MEQLLQVDLIYAVLDTRAQHLVQKQSAPLERILLLGR